MLYIFNSWGCTFFQCNTDLEHGVEKILAASRYLLVNLITWPHIDLVF